MRAHLKLLEDVRKRDIGPLLHPLGCVVISSSRSRYLNWGSILRALSQARRVGYPCPGCRPPSFLSRYFSASTDYCNSYMLSYSTSNRGWINVPFKVRLDPLLRPPRSHLLVFYRFFRLCHATVTLHARLILAMFALVAENSLWLFLL